MSNYNKYLTFTEENPTLAINPFGKGHLCIHSNGTYEEVETGQKGTFETFLKKLYPHITRQGIQAVKEADTLISAEEIVLPNKAIDWFKKDRKLVQTAADLLGVSTDFVKSQPLMLHPRGFKFSMIMQHSPNGGALAVATFNTGKNLPKLYGMFRPEVFNSDRVWVVFNPAIAALIKEEIREDAILWPREQELSYFDYPSLFKGKEVYILYDGFHFNYQNSYFPFYNEIRRSAKNIAIMDSTKFCRQESFGTWIKKKDNLSLLHDKAKKSMSHAHVTQEIYNDSVQLKSEKNVPYAQFKAGDYFFYGLRDGETVVQSYPLDFIPIKDLYDLHGVFIGRAGAYKGTVNLTQQTVVEISESVKQINAAETFRTIENVLRDYIYFEDENSYVLIATYIMGTYVHQLFEAYGYLHLNAPKSSGKTTLIEIISSLSFNGVLSSRMTKARIAEEVGAAQATLCLDEFEKGTAGTGEMFTQLFNSGYKKNGAMRKVGGDNQVMTLYSPKVFASIDAVNKDALASRMIPVNMTKKPKGVLLKSWTNMLGQAGQIMRTIQHGGYSLGLYDWQYIEYLISTHGTKVHLSNGLTLDGRHAEIVLPMVVMAELVDKADTEGTIQASSRLAESIEATFYAQMAREIKLVKMLTNQLKSWSGEDDRRMMKFEQEDYFIATDLFEGTALMQEFSKKKEMLAWIKGLNDRIDVRTKYIDKKSRSSLCLPTDLKLNNRTVEDWFKDEKSQANAEE